MDEKTPSDENLCCVGCLCSNDVNKLQQYNVQSEPLKSFFQVNSITLCYLCKRMAQHAELFIQNVQSNQILLENFRSVLDTTLQTIRAQIQPLVALSWVPFDVIELTDNGSVEESFSVVHNCSKEVKIKVEMKEEENEVLEHLEGEFVDDDDEFQNQYIKDEDGLPLKMLQKEELELDSIDLMSLRKSLKKRKVKKKAKPKGNGLKKLRNDRIPKIETLHLTRKQCMEDRSKMAQDKKYLNCTFKCKDCIKGFNFKSSFEKHLERHSESNGEFECDICKQRVDSGEKLISHRKYHTVRYKCSECELIRMCKRTIMDHYMSFHCQGFFQYPCPHCSKVFTRQVYLRKHVTTHTNKVRVKCAYCDKTYANKDVLKTHIIVRHPKEVSAGEVRKKYICQECGMAFKAPSQLKIHSTKHTHTKDYYCVECDKSFKSDSILKHHLKTASPHINYVELPLACSHCDKRFAIRRDLVRHTNRVHLNIKPFTCDMCDKAYVNGWSLTEHKRYVHDGYKRPLKYPCPMCDKVFDRKQILKGHIRTHTGERPFQCSKCPAQFSQSSILGTHVKLIHLKLTRDGRPKANVK